MLAIGLMTRPEPEIPVLAQACPNSASSFSLSNPYARSVIRHPPVWDSHNHHDICLEKQQPQDSARLLSVSFESFDDLERGQKSSDARRGEARSAGVLRVRRSEKPGPHNEADEAFGPLRPTCQ